MLKRILYLALVIIITSVNYYGAPIKNMPISVTQPNGSIINCFVSGDEYFNYIHDANGYLIIQDDESKYYCYAKQEADKFIPTNLIVGADMPDESMVSKGVNYNLLDVKKLKNKFSIDKSLEDIEAPTTGLIENIVVFIRFAGEPEFTQEISEYNNMFNNQTSNVNSMYNYYKEVSFNSLTVNTNFFPNSSGNNIVSYQDSHPRAYYQPYTGAGSIGYADDNERTNREHTLLKNAINFIASSVPTTLKVDGDNDGEVDNVCFIVSGNPTGWSSLLWPHMWYLYSQSAYINGKRVGTFNFQLQNSLMSSGVGVLCHEMFHSLGAPDLYHYTENGISPVGTWDIMENDLNPPQHMGAHMKYKYGKWISNIPIITSDGTYTLNPLTNAENNCYRINSPRSSNEYFVLEYRKRNSVFESSLGGEGLLVYRIDRRYEGNADGPPDEVFLYRPYGSPDNNGIVSQANLGADVGRKFINSGSNPAAFLADGSPGGLNIYDISSVGDKISFKVKIENSISIIYPSGGENFKTGEEVTLSWENFGSATNYNLFFSTDSGQSWEEIATNLGSSVKTFVFQMPNIVSFDCKIKIVSSTDTTKFDESDYTFAVSPEGAYNLSLLSNAKVGGFTNSIELKDKTAFICSKSAGLHAVNIEDMNNPYLINTFDTDGSTLGVKIVDTLAYLADMTGGVKILNIKDLNNIYQINKLTLPEKTLWLEIIGNVMYVANNVYGFRIFDITDKLNPIEKNRVQTSGLSLFLKVYENYLIVGEGNKGVSFYDITDIYNPIKLTTFDTPGEAVEVVKKNNILFIADKTLGIQIIDISDLQNIIQISSINNIGTVYNVKVSDNYLYAACGNKGVKVYDISDLSNPKLKAYYSVNMFTVDLIDKDGLLYLADQSKGVIVLKNELITETEEINNLAVTDFKLFQNYPNPFNPSTKINFSIPKAGKVSLRVFNILGELIKNSEFQNLEQGINSIDFNGIGLSSGIYIYCIEFEDKILSNKMLLLK